MHYQLEITFSDGSKAQEEVFGNTARTAKAAALSLKRSFENEGANVQIIGGKK